MPLNLKRYQNQGHRHFITFSCHNRLPHLGTPASRDLFVSALESMRSSYNFDVFAFVVMPEHIHLLLSEPPVHPLSSALQALKVSVAKRSPERPFWLPRYHDANITTRDASIDTILYIHRNPIKRGLVSNPAQWPWSSYRHYYLSEPPRVRLTAP